MKGARVVAQNPKAPNAAGLNKLVWNMRMDNVALPGVTAPAAGGRGAGGGGGRGGGGRGGGGGDAAIPSFGGAVPADPGEYTVVVTAGGKTISKTAVVLEDVWFDRMF